MAFILRNLISFLKEVQDVTGKIPGRWIKLEPIVHQLRVDSLPAGATATLQVQTVVNEAFILPFIYGGINGNRYGAYKVDLRVIGPDEKPILPAFDTSILSMDTDKPVITNPVIVVPEGKYYRLELTNNTTAAVTNNVIQVWGFRMEKEAFRAPY
ncbi:MAG: hypothetical protein QW734_03775 [Candidatus Bathyarchaeia archaeon]